MTKPTVPADLMPSAILCYTSHTLSSETHRLIQRCREIQISTQWARMDRIALDVQRLSSTRVPRHEEAIVWVHLADTYWMADSFEPAQRYFEAAARRFSLLTDPKHRNNEAAAVYGLGLVSHAIGDLPQAQRHYSRSLDLLQRSKAYWASEGLNTQTYVCQKTSDLIKHLQDLCVDCPLSALTAGGEAQTSAPQEEAHPFILSVIPADGAQNVPVDVSIVIVFSHPMERSSVDVEIVPNQRLGQPLYVNWYEQDTIAVVRPQNNNFDYGSTYRVKIIGAQDKKGRLLKSGPVPRDWFFLTGETSSRDPAVIDFMGVDRIPPRMDPDTPLVLVFSRPMDVESFGAKAGKKILLPDPGNVDLSWDDTRTVYVVERPRLAGVRLATLDLTSVTDDLGRYLRAPNKLHFFDGYPSSPGHPVLANWPRGSSSETPTNIPLVILFRAKVNSYGVEIAPRPAYQREWLHPSGRVLVIYHSNLLSEMDYTVSLTATDEHDNPVHPITWTFKTGDALPESRSRVLGLSPIDQASNVPRDVRPLVVFTRKMSTSPLDFRVDPSPVEVDWNVDPFARIALIRLAPSSARSGELHTCQILRARDRARQEVITPLHPTSWSFRIESAPPKTPKVEHIHPSDHLLEVAVGEKVTITFSEPMDHSSLVYEIDPEPDYLAVEWDSTGRIATISHSDFRYQQSYQIQIKQARSLSGLHLSVDSVPIRWSFCTEAAPEEPLLRDVYPCHSDVHVPLDTPLLLLFNRSMSDVKCRAGLSAKGQKSQLKKKKWSADHTMVQIELGGLPPHVEYEVEIEEGIDREGNMIRLDRLTHVPNPWQFRTAHEALGWRRTISGSYLNVFVAVVLLALSIAALATLGIDLRLRTEPFTIGPWSVLSFLLAMLVIPWIVYYYRGSLSISPSLETVIMAQLVVVFAAGSVALRLWQGWLAAAAYILTFVAVVILLPLLLRHQKILFSVPPGDEAILQRHGEYRVVEGPAPHAWRVPLLEKLCVIVPMHPVSVYFPACRITNTYQEKIELALDVRYRVFASISAFCHYLQRNGDQESDDIESSKLQAAWKEELRQVIEIAVSDHLEKVRKSDIDRCRQDIEQKLMQILDLATHRWGIELQDVKVAKIRDWQPES